MAERIQPPAYTDTPPSYNASVARISPFDPSLSQTHTFPYHALLLPHRFVPIWEFPIGPIPDWYIDNLDPGWNIGIAECNKILRIISSRFLKLIIAHVFIILGCIGAFFVAVLSQKNLIFQFEYSKIIVPLISSGVMIGFLLISNLLRHKILSMHEPVQTLQKFVDRMGWALEGFVPRVGFLTVPEIQITVYQRSF